MITPNDIPEVITDGLGKVHKFQVKLDAKAFRDLYANRYSRKIEAVIRELCTNAFDSHVAAGKRDVPFQVHLPNNLEPYFEVKDFGTGMSVEDIMKIYIVCFESNRSSSNDFTGGFGLGSKSPFAYTSNFTLTSIHNGTNTVYSVFLDSDGIPCLRKMGSTKTVEQNGVAVNFSVDYKDIDEFAKNAVRVLSVFETKPLIIGRSIEFVEPKYRFKFVTCGLYEKRNTFDGKSRLIMSNVAYPLETSHLPNGISGKSKNLIGRGVDIFAPNGSIQPTTSREAIEWTKHSCDNIKILLERAEQEIARAFEQEASGCKTLWEARKKAYELRMVWSDICNCEVLFNGTKVNYKVHFDSTKYDTPSKKCLGRVSSLRRTAKSVKASFSDNEITANNSPIFIDDAIGSLSRIAYYFDNNPIYRECGFLIKDVPEEWMKETGVDEVAIRTSSLPKPPVNHRTSSTTYGKAEPGKIYLYTGETHKYCQNNWKAVKRSELTDDVVRIYATIDRFKVVGKKTWWKNKSSSELKTFSNCLSQLTGDPIIIYGIRVRDVEKITKKGKWKSLEEYADECLEANKELIKKIRFLNTRVNQRQEIIAENCNHFYKEMRIFKVLVNKALEVKKDAKVFSFNKLSQLFNKDRCQKDYSAFLHKLEHKIEKRFPFISMDDKDLHVKDMVNLITWKEYLKKNPMVF